MNTITNFTITTPAYPADIFAPNAKIVLIDADSYQRLLDLLDADQHHELYLTATNGAYTAISGRLA